MSNNISGHKAAPNSLWWSFLKQTLQFPLCVRLLSRYSSREANIPAAEATLERPAARSSVGKQCGTETFRAALASYKILGKLSQG